jgi:hypothetical protein
MNFALDDFGTDVTHRTGGCCPKCYVCATHFEFFCQALNHMNGAAHDHKVEMHVGKPEAVHSCGCQDCCKWIEIN